MIKEIQVKEILNLGLNILQEGKTYKVKTCKMGYTNPSIVVYTDEPQNFNSPSISINLMRRNDLERVRSATQPLIGLFKIIVTKYDWE